MDYYVVLGIAEDADDETSGVLSARWRGGITRMLAPAPRLLNSSALAKHMKRWPILNAVAGTTGNCEALVPDQSSFEK